MNKNETMKTVQVGGSELNVELDINRLIVDIKHLRIDNAQLQYALEQSETIVDDLAQLVKRLVHSLRRDAPDNRLTDQAMDYLKNKQLLGSAFRGDDFPKPTYKKDRRSPCGECHLNIGETCDICGAVENDA